MRAVITAGGRIDGALANAIGTEIKALAPFGNGTLIDVAIGAARAAGADAIAVVGAPPVLAHVGARAQGIDAAESGGENVLRALGAWPGDDLLFLTCDLPFVSGIAIREFLDAAGSADLAMPVAAADAYEAMFAGAPRHTMSLGGERFANGSVFFFRANAIERVRDTTDAAVRLFEARKSAWAMARVLGLPLLLRFVFRRLTVADIERRADSVTGVTVRAIRACSPVLCFDVDTVEDYRYAVRHASL